MSWRNPKKSQTARHSHALSPFLPSALLAKARLTPLAVVRASSGRRAIRCKLVSSSSMCAFFICIRSSRHAEQRHTGRARLKFASAQRRLASRAPRGTPTLSLIQAHDSCIFACRFSPAFCGFCSCFELPLRALAFCKI